jgi:hypothetical protein
VGTSGKRNASNSKNYATTPATKKNASADGQKLLYKHQGRLKVRKFDSMQGGNIRDSTNNKKDRPSGMLQQSKKIGNSKQRQKEHQK